jgi:amino acid efflux transporter
MIQSICTEWKQESGIYRVHGSGEAMKKTDGHGLTATIGPVQGAALYIGAVLGSGILILPALSAEMAGPAALLAWFGMTLLTLPMALSMGVLSARRPDAGGVSSFVREAFGEVAAAVTGWFFFAAVAIGPVIAVLAAAFYTAAALGLDRSQALALGGVALVAIWGLQLLGMKIAGRVQVALVIATVGVLLLAIGAGIPQMRLDSFTPFAPNGWLAVGKVGATLFWGYIGWEAVSHMSAEFVDPKRHVLRAATLAALVVGVLYFATALVTVGAGLKGSGDDAVALMVYLVRGSLGPVGGLVIGVSGLVLCLAGLNAYVGGAARVGYSLAQNNAAPRLMGYLLPGRNTPAGSLLVLAVVHTLMFVLFALGKVSIAGLIGLPNAGFIATYIAGSLAGVKLLRGTGWPWWMALISLVVSCAMYPFLGWAALYPLGAAAVGAAAVYLGRRQQVDRQAA